MKIHSLLLTTCISATLLMQPSSHAQDAAPVASAAPAASATPGAPPKFGADEKSHGKGLQSRRNPEERLAHLKEALALTPEQETKIREIFKNEVEKIRTYRQANKDQKGDPVANRQKMKEMRDEVEASVSAVLTPEQKAKWDTMKKDRKERGPKTEVPKA